MYIYIYLRASLSRSRPASSVSTGRCQFLVDDRLVHNVRSRYTVRPVSAASRQHRIASPSRRAASRRVALRRARPPRLSIDTRLDLAPLVLPRAPHTSSPTRVRDIWSTRVCCASTCCVYECMCALRGERERDNRVASCETVLVHLVDRRGDPRRFRVYFWSQLPIASSSLYLGRRSV